MNTTINKTEGQTGKPKHKFNFIDFLILLLIVAIIGTAIYAVFAWSDIKALWSTSSKDIQYIVELRGVDSDFIDNIKSNDIVIDSVSKNQLGIVQATNTEDPYKIISYEEILDKDGNPTGDYNGVLIEDKDNPKYNITVYINATAEYEKGVGYTVNGTRIAVGEVLELRFPQFTAVAYCTHISESNQA